VGTYGLDACSIELGPVAGSCEYGNERSGSIKREQDFLTS
jgi:hypothetical protein